MLRDKSQMQAPLRFRTARLELIAGSAQTVRAERDDRRLLEFLLDAIVPPDWPPDLNDLEMKDLSIRWFEEHPEDEGWLCWYFVLSRPGLRKLIGIGGFSSTPLEGTVEIGYSILPDYQRQGYATEAVRGLCNWAFAHAEVLRVLAEVHPGFERSAGVLEKCGFSRCPPPNGSNFDLFELRR